LRGRSTRTSRAIALIDIVSNRLLTGPTGKKLDAQACHVWKIRDGKVASFQQYVDTAQLQGVEVPGRQLLRDLRARQVEESQRVMGFPVDWFGTIDRGGFLPLTHPIRGYKRWLRRRRLGPYAVDEDEP
jgi:hypothetical protein